MKLLDYLGSNVGRTVYITGYGDRMMDGELRPLIRNKTPLILEKVTKGGMACVLEGKKRYVVPPRNIHVIQDNEKSYADIQDEHLRMEYTNKIKELVEKPVIRDDFDEEWMNKMTDEELDQFEKESFEMCLEKGSTEQYSDETHSEEVITKLVANYIDRGILYELFKEQNGR